MLDFIAIMEQFKERCTACGACLSVCPIFPLTDLKEEDPVDVMEEVLTLVRHNKISRKARTMAHSCLYCNTCVPHCPEELLPGLSLVIARGTLIETGDPIPEGSSFILRMVEDQLEKITQLLASRPEVAEWLKTDLNRQKPTQSKTVFFTSCLGLFHTDAINVTMDVLRRIDPTIKALGGIDHCCGERYLANGYPQKAQTYFSKLVESFRAFSPKDVVVFCPTCTMNFNLLAPDAPWKWHFITDYLAERLDDLGPLGEVNATVTLHDSCHFVRGKNLGSPSPRKILNALPGVKLIEMKNTRENATSCAAYTIPWTERIGGAYRDLRLLEAQETGADMLGVYCPGCRMVFEQGDPVSPPKIEFVTTLLAKSLGIV
jgi:Fe-S oxidoreductase